MASNVAGDTEAHFKLNMLQTHPEFIKKLPRNMEVDEADKLVLSCKVDGSPLPTVKWFKDSEEVKPNNEK